MPVHDWTRVDEGIFHAFHLAWVSFLQVTMNTRHLPPNIYSLAERLPGGLGPKMSPAPVIASGERRCRLVIRRASHHQVVALLEIVTPGHKASRKSLHSFVDQALAALAQGIHLLVIDLQPPTSHDPQGIHGLLWEQLAGEPHEQPAETPLTLAAYNAENPVAAYVEPLDVGSKLLDMPLFLQPDIYVPVPLEEAYLAAFAGMPAFYRNILEA
jgi:hypothetical protein